MIFDCLWSEYFSYTPFWNCLHFFDRSLSLESDFWSFTFCRLLPRWGRVSCLKSHELPFCWHITHEDVLRLIFRNSFYALLCRRSVCTILLNFNFTTFISLAKCHYSFTSWESASCYSVQSRPRFCVIYAEYSILTQNEMIVGSYWRKKKQQTKTPQNKFSRI